jgi:hypothetical protein
MAVSQNNISFALAQKDAAAMNLINRTVGSFEYTGTVGTFLRGTLTTTGATALTLPITAVLQCYIVNTHSSATITIIGTPQAGASATLGVLYPGGIFVNWQAASGASAGFTALSLTASATGASYEAFLGG